MARALSPGGEASWGEATPDSRSRAPQAAAGGGEGVTWTAGEEGRQGQVNLTPGGTGCGGG